jgi:hypothetical protein
MRQGEYVLASHDPIECALGIPCIHFRKVKEYETASLITLESIHHALCHLDGSWALDDAWESFHGLYWAARRLLRI